MANYSSFIVMEQIIKNVNNELREINYKIFYIESKRDTIFDIYFKEIRTDEDTFLFSLNIDNIDIVKDTNKTIGAFGKVNTINEFYISFYFKFLYKNTFELLSEDNKLKYTDKLIDIFEYNELCSYRIGYNNININFDYCCSNYEESKNIIMSIINSISKIILQECNELLIKQT